MEAFQTAFYGEGRDVLAPEVQMRMANVDGDVFMRALEDPDVQAAAEAEREEALDILGDFVVYPTLFLETDDGERHVLARGYADYPVVAAKLASVLGGGADGSEHTPRQRVRPRRHCNISAWKGRPGELFQNSSFPEPIPQELRFVERPRNRSSFRSRGKLPILCASLFPLFSKSKTRPDNMSERVLFLSTRKADKEGFDNIESLGRKEPGEGRCCRCP